MMKVDIFLELSASTVAFISCRGRLPKSVPLVGKWEVRVGEAEWDYQMLIPGNWACQLTISSFSEILFSGLMLEESQYQ